MREVAGVPADAAKGVARLEEAERLMLEGITAAGLATKGGVA